jgi:hypothetical protein
VCDEVCCSIEAKFNRLAFFEGYTFEHLYAF